MHEKEPVFDSLNRKSLFIRGRRKQRPLSCSPMDGLSALGEGHFDLPERGGAPG